MMRRMTDYYMIKLALNQANLVVAVQSKHFIKQNIRGYYLYFNYK